ncbi:aspartate/glutamate racemase family protein [Natranaerobius thermophilus]|uniref:Asp/Glu/hydantoin racemase n=1 Tax=Natranaerobius thermophilus (strain ATCC BAA-1301 / DSM 18059 / JW/NM-WN-LF) TaxID=457570 RepID=B2A842_NATTJ|nr:aspartate/glutamate racemase family protein [Natranaerobius thermophilus]ACB85810.1 Asp/Glu/hydantoin racemase [Natranaerobius thermophilus JW/NM-WN-LF]
MKSEQINHLGVIAGTPVDTEMGEMLLRSKAFTASGKSISATPEEQAKMQVLEQQRLFEETLNKVKELRDLGAEGVIIYCNSLSASLDLDKLKKLSPLPIVTPLDIYKEIANDFQTIALMSATNSSNITIEKVMRQNNSYITVLGFSLLPVVLQIEKGVAPEKIVHEVGIKDLLAAISKLKVESLILACTHFPYFKDEVDELISEQGYTFELIDPAEKMVEKFLNYQKI